MEIIMELHRHATPNDFKQMGNDAFSSHLYLKAIEMYTNAIDLDPTNAVYYANRSAAYIKLKQYTQAKKDLAYALIINPDYYFAYYRNGYVNVCLGTYNTAIASYTKATGNVWLNSGALRHIQHIKRRKLYHFISKYETLSHPPIKIDYTFNYQASNLLYYKNSINGLRIPHTSILIFYVDIQTLRVSINRYNVTDDTYSVIDANIDAGSIEMDNAFDHCYKLIPMNSLYLKDGVIHIQGKRICYNSIQHSKALIYSSFLNGIWSFNVYQKYDSNDVISKMMHFDLKQEKWIYFDEFPVIDLDDINVCVVIGFKHLIFLFFCIENEIWCYDLWLHRKWIKSKYSFPSTFGHCKSVVDVDRNYVHFMDVRSNENDRFHFKMELHQLIPVELLRFYKPKCDILVCGYVNKINQENVLSHFISSPLVQLILNFCPIFA